MPTYLFTESLNEALFLQKTRQRIIQGPQFLENKAVKKATKNTGTFRYRTLEKPSTAHKSDKAQRLLHSN